MEVNEQGAGKKKPAAKIAIIVLLLVVIILLCAVIWMMFFCKNRGSGTFVKENTSDVPVVIGEEDDADEVLKKLQERADDTRFNCRMSYTWTFADGEKKSEDAYVANTDYNHYPLYFEVQLDDTQEIIYTSGLIPVGSEVNGITLDEELPAGDYPATVIYHLVNDDDEEVSSVGFTITIQVQE